MRKNCLLLFALVFCCWHVRAAQPAPQELRRLIDALGDKNYFVRQRAEQQLAKIGFEAVDALAEATDSDDLEIVARSARLLRMIRSNWNRPGDPSGVAQAFVEYDALDDAGREARINQLASLADHQGAPAVCRVICYDRSLALAKSAAVKLMQSFSGGAVKPAVAAEIRKQLTGCRRPPGEWVLDWLAAGSETEAVTAVWAKIVAGESDLLLRHPRDTAPAIIESLLQLQIAAYRTAHRDAEAADSLIRLMKLHRGDPAALAKLLRWLVEQKNWPATRLVEKQFQDTIAVSSDLLYLSAEAQLLRGDADAAGRSAAAAVKLNPGADEQSLAAHYQAGFSLEERGRSDWAINELEHVVRHAPPESSMAPAAARLLSELYHDLDRDQEAAETLARVEKTFARRSNQWLVLGNGNSGGQSLGDVRARRHYFEACHWRDQHDRPKQLAALDAALATQSYDIEVLIECYGVPNAPTDYRAKTRKLIVKKLCELRERIGDNSENYAAAQPCNEFAWLVANTEGDLDEALRYSQRSLELTGKSGAFRDTLARVYYAKGDLDTALKEQTAAVASLPHNRAMQKQLELLRAKVAERKKNPKKPSRT